MAEARYNVVLKNRKSTLYTDSLNYDRLYNIGYFFDGGKLVDQGNTLTADWGEYHTDSKEAIFNYDVKLRGQNFILTSDTLYYNTNTSMAHAVGPSNITSGESKIYTEDGYYDTKHDKSKLYARSVVTNNGKTIIGDSVYHDSKSGTNEAFRNVVYTDTVNKNRLTCDYCFYNEQTGYGMATKKRWQWTSRKKIPYTCTPTHSRSIPITSTPTLCIAWHTHTIKCGLTELTFRRYATLWYTTARTRA